MYSCIKFQLILKASDFGAKLAQKIVHDKNFENIYLKFGITI